MPRNLATHAGRERDRRIEKVTRRFFRAVMEDAGLWRCHRCGSPDHLSVDHITPISQGGSVESLANLQVLCLPCHVAKTRLDHLMGLRRTGAMLRRRAAAMSAGRVFFRVVATTRRTRRGAVWHGRHRDEGYWRDGRYHESTS